MGLDITSIRYLCWLKQTGCNFKKVAMLGRHAFYGLNPDTLSKAVEPSGLKMTTNEGKEILTEKRGYTEPFFHWLGADTVDSYDFSTYENATHIWDMNKPLNKKSKGCYDFVFDGGTLEHVFNYSNALREAMTMPKIGGIFLSATPANSYIGHGLYQFGPDLPYSIMQPLNGYKIGKVHLVEMRRSVNFYEVLPPSITRGRALASTPWPTIMYFFGTRNDEVPDSLQAFQPDYEDAWAGKTQSPNKNNKPITENAIRTIANLFPIGFRIDFLRFLKLGYTLLINNSFYNKNYFKRSKDI